MCEIGFKQDKNKLSLDIILLKTIILIFNQIENARLSLKLLLLEKKKLSVICLLFCTPERSFEAKKK